MSKAYVPNVVRLANKCSLLDTAKTKSTPQNIRNLCAAATKTPDFNGNISKKILNDKHNRRNNLTAKSTVQKQRSFSTEAAAQKDPNFPSSAEVVVIGGGSLGCNALYHLAKKGITNTVLLETHKLTAGTTWHTAGLVWDLARTDVETEIVQRTVRLLKSLEDETGVGTGWINNGGLFIAKSPERLDEMRRLLSIARCTGIEAYLLTPAEIKKIYPLMRVDDLAGALYSTGCGTLDPAGFCEALTRGAKSAGAKVFENTQVTGIDTKEQLLGGKQVTTVHTTRGSITTNCVINATGAWANSIASMVGLHVPLIPIKHAYVVTEKIEGIQNMPNCRDYEASTYLKLQGDALSIGGYEMNPNFLEPMKSDFAFGLYDLDYDVFGWLNEGHIHRLPVLENIGIKSTVCGPESFTPDHKAIMGEDPDVGGFFHCCGFNSGGMMLGGGCGQEIAEWVKTGRPELDMFSYDVRRFHPPMFRDKKWVDERSHEAYAKNYSIVFKHDEPLAARGRRKSALHKVLEDAGCVYQERLGWERPGWFTSQPVPVQPYDWYGFYDHTPLNADDRYKKALMEEYTFNDPPHEDVIAAECHAARTAVVAYDMSYFSKLYLTGPDAKKAADFLFSADVTRGNDAVVYTCMLNQRGGVEADLTVSVLEGGAGSACDPCFEGAGYYLAIGGAAATQNYAHIVKEVRKHGWDVNLLDHTEDMSLISVQGPKSRELLQKLSSCDFSNEAFPFSTHQLIEVAGHKTRALRVSFVGELGWELHVPNESAVAVYQAVAETGKQFGFRNSGYRAMDCLSNEKGYRHWHSDVRSDDTPLEANLAFTCKLKTGIDFLGRAALLKQKETGLRKKYVVLSVDNLKQPMLGFEGIRRNGVSVGLVRRAEPAHYLGTTIAHGYVKKEDGDTITKDYLTSGTWTVDAMGKEVPAKLHIREPFDPKNERIKGNYIHYP